MHPVPTLAHLVYILQGVARPRGMASRSLLPVLLGHVTPRDVRRVVTSGYASWRLAVTTVALPGQPHPLAVPAFLRAGAATRTFTAAIASATNATMANGTVVLAAAPSNGPSSDAPRWLSVRVQWSVHARVPDCAHQWTLIDPTTNYQINQKNATSLTSIPGMCAELNGNAQAEVGRLFDL